MRRHRPAGCYLLIPLILDDLATWQCYLADTETYRAWIHTAGWTLSCQDSVINHSFNTNHTLLRSAAATLTLYFIIHLCTSVSWRLDRRDYAKNSCEQMNSRYPESTLEQTFLFLPSLQWCTLGASNLDHPQTSKFIVSRYRYLLILLFSLRFRMKTSRNSRTMLLT